MMDEGFHDGQEAQEGVSPAPTEAMRRAARTALARAIVQGEDGEGSVHNDLLALQHRYVRAALNADRSALMAVLEEALAFLNRGRLTA